MSVTMMLAGLGVGIVVGLTGMGGGALMTPILVLLFGVPPLAAVSSDLAASAVMKPFGGWIHARRGTVNWRLVGWLCAGSVPSAFSAVLLVRLVGSGSLQRSVQLALGVALVLAALGLLAKAYLSRLEANPAAGGTAPRARAVTVRPVATALLGALGGLVVGLTSVGSGSIIIVVLVLLYPTLRSNDLVGTDLVQAVPLVASAALGHLIFGDLRWDVAGTVLIGSVPGVLLGAQLSARAPATVVRSALIVVLVASAARLFGAPNLTMAVVVAATIVLVLATRWLRRGSVTASSIGHLARDTPVRAQALDANQ